MATTNLKSERERRGWKKLRAISELEAAARARGDAIASRTSLERQLARWENGDKPADWVGPDQPYRQLFCEIYGRTAAEFGWAAGTETHEAELATTLTYHPALGTSLAALGTLTNLDTQSQPSINAAPYSADTLTSLAMDWLFADNADGVTGGQSTTVTQSEVDEIRLTIKTLDQLDRQVGGEASREVAVRFLRDRVLPRLSGHYSRDVGRDLFHASAVLCELIGWSAYDMGRHAIAQRYFAQGLRMSSAAGHRSYGAYILTSMSDQALFLGHAAEALRLSRAAQDSASRAPSVLTEATLLEARARSILGDERGATTALTRAERAFERIGTHGADASDTTPMTEVILASHTGTCWVDLAHPERAKDSFTTAFSEMQGQARRRVYGTIQLARVALLQQDLAQACALGLEALRALDGLPSYRSSQHLQTLVASVESCAGSDRGSAPADVEAFLAQARMALCPPPQPSAPASARRIR